MNPQTGLVISQFAQEHKVELGIAFYDFYAHGVQNERVPSCLQSGVGIKTLHIFAALLFNTFGHVRVYSFYSILTGIEQIKDFFIVCPIIDTCNQCGRHGTPKTCRITNFILIHQQVGSLPSFMCLVIFETIPSLPFTNSEGSVRTDELLTVMYSRRKPEHKKITEKSL